MAHNFNECLSKSHAASDLPIWEETYKKAFPEMLSMVDHRNDGWHQRAGVDRSIIFESSKQILVDEKIRFRDYGDIILEYFSDRDRKTPGWARKPLLADYIAYAVAPAGICYMLPVVQMQSAFQKNKKEWFREYKKVKSQNEGYVTESLAVKPDVLMAAISEMFCITFTKVEDPNA